MCSFKLLVLTSLMLASSVVAAQQTPSNVGILTCTLVPGEGQARPLSCGFKPASTGGEGRTLGPSERAERAFKASKFSFGLSWRLKA